MARAGVYTFRGRNVNLQQALRREVRKSPSSQGTRTFARDLRRFFLLAGLLSRDQDDALRVSPLGRQLLRHAANAPQSIPIWRTAMNLVGLENDADGTVAHPYRILLRLVGETPGIESVKLALALEARNDSEAEFARVRALAGRPWDEVREELGVSEHHARNATKILPAIARQLNDLQVDGHVYSRVVPVNHQLQGRRRGSRARQRRGRRRRHRLGNRRVTPGTIAQTRSFQDRPTDEQEFANPALTAKMRRQRLNDHQRLVRSLADMLHEQGYELFEDPYDVLGRRDADPTILTEAKTLNGQEADEIAQVRAALAQLLYYDNLSVASHLKSHGLLSIALFNRRISEKHTALLEAMRISVCWIMDGQLFATGESSDRLQAAGLDVQEPAD